MPAPVPAGYTRGPILFIAESTTREVEDELLQTFWRAAGSYGSRILIVNIHAATDLAGDFAARFRTWEAGSVAIVTIRSRSDAQSRQSQEEVDRATGILILADSAVHAATLIGGTPLAQSLRRANARSKVLAAYGSAMALLCQHIPVPQTTPLVEPNDAPVYFTPGLGAINRVVIETGTIATEQRLLRATASNPFLIAVAADANSGVMVTPDNLLTVLGRQPAILADAAQMTETNLHESGREGFSITGAHIYQMPPGASFSLDNRTLAPKETGEPPEEQGRVTSAF